MTRVFIALAFAVLLSCTVAGCAGTHETGYDPEQQAAMIRLVDSVAEAKTEAELLRYEATEGDRLWRSMSKDQKTGCAAWIDTVMDGALKPGARSQCPAAYEAMARRGKAAAMNAPVPGHKPRVIITGADDVEDGVEP